MPSDFLLITHRAPSRHSVQMYHIQRHFAGKDRGHHLHYQLDTANEALALSLVFFGLTVTVPP